MSLNWRTVRTIDVEQACALVASGEQPARVPAKGIFLTRNGQLLPAKHVLRLAYCIANKLPLDSKLKFSSGDGTVNTLSRLGFAIERR
jgi:hypothetical protein